MLARNYTRDDGSTIQIGRLLIDYGYVKEIVDSVIRKLNQTTVVMPSKGQGITAGNKPMSEYDRRPGEIVGHYWRVPPAHGRELRFVNIDTNYWKTLLQGRLAIPMGDRGCFSLYGTDRTDHQLVADHLSAEYRVQTQGRGRTVWEWKMRRAAPTITYWTALSVAPWELPCSISSCQEAYQRPPHGKPR